jgi:hypothetical protein
MVRKLGQVLVLTLAINFIALAGVVGWLWQSGRLGKEQVCRIKEVLFPGEAKAEVKLDEPANASLASTQPVVKLEELLAKAAGRTASEQVEFIQQAFDSQRSELDRRFREVEDMRRQVELAQKQLATDRTSNDAKEKQLTDREQSAQKTASDKGFQDALVLYQALPSKQVKELFGGLEDETVVRYLQAMPPRTASKIVKEFKTPDETNRIQRVLERMRQNQASAGN